MTEEQFIEITEWQDKTFPKSTTLSRIRHLTQEANELFEAVAMEDESFTTNKQVEFEFADCFILLFGAAKKYGLSYEDICQVIEEKMKVNRKRTWGAPDENGVVNHLKSPATDGHE